MFQIEDPSCGAKARSLPNATRLLDRGCVGDARFYSVQASCTVEMCVPRARLSGEGRKMVRKSGADMARKLVASSDEEIETLTILLKKTYHRPYKRAFERLRCFFYVMYELDCVPKLFYLKCSQKVRPQL